MEHRKTIALHAYDHRWPDAFRREADRLIALFLPERVAIHHIGSTSVSGLCAKPVIDILIEAADLAVLDRASSALEQLGYTGKGEHGIAGRRYFSRPASHTELKVHVHAFERGSPHVARHLRFRDYLRAHPAVAARYGLLKQRLAAEHHADAAAYQAGKSDFIKNAEAAAHGLPGEGDTDPQASAIIP